LFFAQQLIRKVAEPGPTNRAPGRLEEAVDFAQEQRTPGKHVVGIGIVLGLHLVLGWALLTGLAQRMVEVIKAPIETKIIEEVKPPPEVQVNPPPTPAPTITTTQVAPPPTVVTVAPAPPPVAAAPAAAPPPPAAPRQAARPAIGNVGACAPKDEDYPPAAAKNEVTGTTRVKFTVGADGKLANAEVIKSAGPTREHRLLDRMAVTKLSECAFKPGADENGKPMGGSFEVEYVWKLN
jgi:periplasmic protein TonB